MVNEFNWQTFHYYDNFVSSFISFFLNMLLIGLIRTRTPLELKPYSKILLQTAIVDLNFTIVYFITKEQMEINDGIFVLRVSGFFGSLPNPINFALNLLFEFSIWLCICASPIPFLYRYMLICKEQRISNKTFMYLYFLVALISICYSILFSLAFPPESMQVEKYFAIMNNEYWRDEEGKVPVFVASEVSNPFMILIVLCATTMSTVSYILIITLNIKVWKKLRESRHIMSAKTQQLQKQLTHVLIIQAISPIITATLPVLAAVICGAILRLKLHDIGLSIMCAIAWITVINPLSAIIFVSPYRNTLLYFFKNLTKTNPTTTQINYLNQQENVNI